MALFEGAGFMDGYMVRLAGSDLVLGVVRGGVMGIAFIVEIFGVDLYDRAGDDAGFGVPGYVVADFKVCVHRWQVSLSNHQKAFMHNLFRSKSLIFKYLSYVPFELSLYDFS